MSARFWSGMRVTTPGRRTVECGSGISGRVRMLDDLVIVMVVLVVSRQPVIALVEKEKESEMGIKVYSMRQ